MFVVLALFAFAGFCVEDVKAVGWETITPLDDYVNRPDPHYEYHIISTIYDVQYTVYIINMTSQKWMDESFSDEPVWWHYLSLFVPTQLVSGRIYDAAFIHISGGNHNDSIPTMEDSWMQRTAAFCVNTGAVAAWLRCVPYQPVRFPDGLLEKVEDFIIGYTWRLYIEDPGTPNPDIVALLPMVKAAKMAIDTMDEFTSNVDHSYHLTKFMPTGFSKRGWTSWLLGCVDQRVFAMAPTVYDLLNFQENLEHHYQAYGGWSWAFFPYWRENVTQYLYHPRVPEMAKFIDPFEFNERLTMPKLIISAAGDQFFLPDDANFFFDQLNEGPNFLQIWENDDHGLGDHLDERDHNLQAFFLHVYNRRTFPVISWIRMENEVSGRISVMVDTTPLTITSWWADTTNVTCEPDGQTNGTCRRDFRIRTAEEETGVWWTEQPVFDLGGNEYLVAYDIPEFGYRGFFVEMTFPGIRDYTLRFTTEMNIIPNTFPYPKCTTEEECKGRIV